MGNKNTERKKRNKQNRKQRKNQKAKRFEYESFITKDELIRIEAENDQGFADLLECGDK